LLHAAEVVESPARLRGRLLDAASAVRIGVRDVLARCKQTAGMR